MLPNQKIENIRSRKVNIIFGSHHVTRTTACLYFMSRFGYFTEAWILEAVFPRGPNLEYTSQEQARGLSLSHEILSEAHIPLLVSMDAILYK